MPERPYAYQSIFLNIGLEELLFS
ncbi:hypothetical protein OIU78_021798 [Salix suchowensis]|nr:hypothetical protein OIU78_021798 [Salix suchowensis]